MLLWSQFFVEKMTYGIDFEAYVPEVIFLQNTGTKFEWEHLTTKLIYMFSLAYLVELVD